MTSRLLPFVILAALCAAFAACGGGGGVAAPPPTIDGIQPASGAEGGGTGLAINGSGFGAPATVTVGGVAAGAVDVVGPGLITCTTPPGTGGATVDIVVSTQGETLTRTAAFTYIAAPTVTGVAPAMGPPSGGTAVTITGTNFLAESRVTFGTELATNVTVMSATTITCNTPAGAGTVAVGVKTEGGNGSLAGGFTYQAAPLQAKQEAAGVVYLAWSVPAADGAGAEVHCVRSPDGGRTWPLPSVRIDDVPGSAGREILEVVCCAHRVCVAWRESREDGSTGPVYYSYSTDGGLTWRTTDVRIDAAD